MKQYKKPVALVAALALMATLLAGCSNDGGKSAEGLSGKEVLAKVQENMQKVKSLSYKTSMDIDLTAEMGGNSESAKISMEMDADIINEPTKLMATMKTDMLGTAQNMQIYAEEVDGAMVVYASNDDGATWSPTTMDLSQFDVAESLDTYMSLFKEVKESGKETINGVEATKFNCIIPNDKLVDVINASGTLDSLSIPGMGTDDLNEMIAGMGDLTFDIWVDTDQYLPVQYSFDMSAMMSKMMEDMIPGAKIEITKTLMEMTIAGVDTVNSIDRPASIPA